MARKNMFILVLMLSVTSLFAQIKPEQFKPFIGNQEIIDSSGPGLKAASGDILLELKEPGDPDMMTLMLLRRTNGKLKRIAENSELLMGQGMLGISGGGSAGITDKELYVDYQLGSNSAVSNVSIVFKKSSDGNYYFNEYTANTSNYGVENLFARERITAGQTERMDFAAAGEDDILKKGKSNTSPVDPEAPLYEAADRYKSYIPLGFRLAAFSVGDLNLDRFEKDLLLVLYNEEVCGIRLLLQLDNSAHKLTEGNTQLIVPDETFNINNIKVIIKNGFFTVERRVPVMKDDFDHQYITFKYNAAQKNWFLHRFDVEHFKGFDATPSKDATHLTTRDFGKTTFQEMKSLPGIYHYEPDTSVVSGTIIKKQFYGRPNYGETPEKDEKVWVYILKPDIPVNVYGNIDPQGPEMTNKTVTNINEIQVYSTDSMIDLGRYRDKKVKLQGLLIAGSTGYHHTKVLMEVKKFSQLKK